MSSPPAPIGVIGVGCRLPGGASNLDKLWELLSEGRSGRTEIPKDRWNADEWFDAYPEAKQSVVTKHGYFLQEDVSQFDAKFFGISSAEAHSMDPQQRLFLMTSYEAIEDAGIPIETLRGSNTGVFASIFERGYDRMGHKDLSTIGRTHMNGTGEAILSNRISYCFDLQGPCMTIDTGCSGSLVALHQACYSLRSGESDLALVGGSQLILNPELLTLMSGMGMVNPDGMSYVFDSRGAGYGRGEGVATILLKRLDKALADGDRVHAVIANSGMNQDGKTTGINNPSGAAQAALASRVYREAGLNPGDTSFVEAHGTGTQVGDREEISSISKVFCEEPGREDDLYVGSIKSNIGHLEATSGIAGLLKCILMLKHGSIPPNLNYINPKPSLKLYEKKIKIPTEGMDLPAPRSGGPRRISLNSFGYGGSNCHVIVEEASTVTKLNGHTNGFHTPETNGTSHTISSKAVPQLFVLSASTEKALSSLLESLKDWVESHERTPNALRRLSYALGAHRSAFQCRRAIVASTAEELLTELNQTGNQKRVTSNAPISFVFSGQGAQWHAMGRELMISSPCFRRSIVEMQEMLLEQGCEWSLIEELSKSSDESRVGEAEISQPATTAIQIALVDLLESLSIRPSRVLGHSSGEIGAAYAAGALSRDSAIIVAYQRGLFSAKAKAVADIPGSMMAVSLQESDATQHVKRLTRGTAVVACVNSPSSMTISGDETAIDELKVTLDAEGVFARKLKVDTAYHSHHMRRVGGEYEDAIKNIETFRLRDGVTFYSSVTGQVKKTGFGADYWTTNMVSQVKFSEALTLLRDEQTNGEASMDSSIFVEIGPHSALAGPSRQTLGQVGAGRFKFEYLSALVRNNDAVKTTLSLVSRIFELGLEVDMAAALAIIDTKKPQIVRDLKSYPWDLAPYWRESRLSKASRFRPFPNHDLLGLLDPASTIHEPRWRYHLNLDGLPWLRDHVVDGFTLYPAAGYLTMAIEAMKQLVQMRKSQKPVARFILRDVVISKSIILDEPENGTSDSEVEVQLSMNTASQHEGGRWESFCIRTCDADGTWNEHCSGEITAEFGADGMDEVEGNREAELREQEAKRFLDETRQQCDADMSKTEFYDFAKRTGNNYDGAFSPIENISYGDMRGILHLLTPDIGALMPYRSFRPHVIHPITLAAIPQLHCMLFNKFISNAPCVPTKISLLEIDADISSKAGDSLTGAVQIEADGAKASKGQSWMFQEDPNGQLKPVIRLSVNLRAIGEAIEDDNRPFIQDKVNRLDWGLDADFMTEEAFLNKLASSTGLNENTTYNYEGNRVAVTEVQEDFRAADLAACIWLRDAMRYLEDNNIEVTKPYLAKYLAWMKKWLSSDYYKELMSGLSPEDERKALQRIASAPNHAPEMQMLARIGKALPDILTERAEALAVMLEGNLLIRSYEGGSWRGDYEAAVEYLKVLTFKNPRLRFLEIGAGTGGCTKRIFSGLAGHNAGQGLLPLEKYAYTDISSGFFPEARSTFAEWEDYIDFKTLDVEKDPIEQGFEAGSYDVVVAVNVLHATKNMNVTMTHVRKLLRPGGSLVLVDNTPRGVAPGLVFGTLSGWWAHEDEYREDTALMQREQWQTILTRTGFAGLLATRGAMMASKAVSLSRNGTAVEEKKIVLIRDEADDRVDELVKVIPETTTEETQWDQISIQDDTVYLIVDRAEKPLLLDPQPHFFEALSRLTSAKAQILWVVLQETNEADMTAYKGTVTSVIRVLRRESQNTGLVSLDIRHPSPGPDETAKIIADIAHRSFWTTTPDQQPSELEFAYENGQVLIPRVRPDTKFLKWARQKWTQSGTHADAADEVETAPYQGDRALKLEIATPGLLASMRFVDNETPSDIAPGEIEVKAYAHGVNYKDVCVAQGQTSPGMAMVGEFSGVVVAVGADMKEVYQVGDRVMGFGAQPFSNRSRVHGCLAHKTPASLSDAVAASIPHAYVTAYHSIMETARLESGQSILIHGASGGVGQAAIQLAQHVGAQIFCTVSSAAKRQLLIDEYGISEGYIFSSQTQFFKQGIMRLTDGHGVDVVLGSLSGETLSNSLDCVKTLGTFIQLGKSDMQRGSHLSMPEFERSITFTSFDLASLSERKPKHIHRVLKEVITFIESKVLRPHQPITTYPVEKIEEAFRFVAARKHTGKVVLEADPASMVNCLLPKTPALKLSREGTYVVTGRLDGLPSRICQFLASHGAGHIVSLSRTSTDDATKEKHTSAIEALGGTLHILNCDFTNEDQMRGVVDYCSGLPPVRGVVHSAFALDNHAPESMFSQTQVNEWTLALKDHVTGTVNLDHSFASPNLEFFVALSSSGAIVGMSGLSGRVAGSGFQDAYMQAHMKHPDTHYLSINLGDISNSKDTEIEAKYQQNSITKVSLGEFFANFEYAVNGLARADGLHQTIQGITRQSILDANDEYLLSSAIFSQLPQTQERKSGGTARAEKIDFGEALGRARTAQEAEQMVRDAVVAKFAVFLDRSVDEIRVDQSLSSIGLDSLVSIELKNWISRTFQVSLQTSELGGSGTILALTTTVVARSKLVSDEVRQTQHEDARSTDVEVVAPKHDEVKPNHNFYCCRTREELPRYPLVDLDDAVKDLLASVGHFAHNREEYEELCRKVDALIAPGGLGRRLYGQLRAKADDPNVESWIADLLLKALHLKRRYTLAPFGNFMCTHFDSEVPHTQAERASTLTRAVCEFKKDRDAGRLEPDFLGTRANCSNSRDWLFNAVREPNVGCDKMMRYPGNEYVAVLRKGRLFQIQLLDGDDPVSHEKLRAAYQAILNLDLDEKSYAGLLTTDNRDAWGSNRQTLLSVNDKNAAYFEVMEASAFIVCLDDNSPVTREERVYAGYLGNSFNRWHDKCIQIIVTANGRSASIFEHSMIDIIPTWQLTNRMQSAINDFVPSNDSPSVEAGSPEELPLITTPEIDAHIKTLRANYQAIADSKKYVPHLIPSFGKTFMLSHAAPIKATVDMTIQLASRMYFGYLPASWETVSTSHFHLGRPEIVQVVRAEVIDFCDAALDDNVPRAEVRDKLLHAARAHNAQVAKGTEGKNYFRLMDVLEVMSQDQDTEPVPEMFSDPVWRRGYPRLIMQTIIETKLWEDPAFAMPDPESVWMNYTVFEDSLEVCFVSPIDKAERFQEALNRAADMVKTIIAARQE